MPTNSPTWLWTNFLDISRREGLRWPETTRPAFCKTSRTFATIVGNDAKPPINKPYLRPQPCRNALNAAINNPFEHSRRCAKSSRRQHNSNFAALTTPHSVTSREATRDRTNLVMALSVRLCFPCDHCTIHSPQTQRLHNYNAVFIKCLGFTRQQVY